MRWLFLCAWIFFVSPAHAATRAQAPPTIEQPVEIQFNPGTAPLDMQSELRRETRRNGQMTVQVLKSTDRVSHVRDAQTGAYRIVWQTLSYSVDADEQMKPFLTAIVKGASETPLIYLANANGEPQQIVNLAAIKASLASSLAAARQSLFEKMPEMPAEQRATFDTLFNQATANFSAMDDQRATAQFLETPMMMYGFGGASLQPGVKIPFETSIPQPVLKQPIKVRGTIELTHFDPILRHAHIITSTQLDPDDLKSAVEKFTLDLMTKVAPKENSDAHAQIQKQIQALGTFNVVERAELTVEADTGRPVALRYQKISSIGEEVRTETRRYTRK